jgi:transcriptional regulator with XRE-family HTH domain
MTNSSFNYVRTFRKRHALSKFELAFLIGQRSDSAVHWFERGDRKPTLEAALALQILFSQVPHQLFPGLYEAVEERVMRRAAQMLRDLEGRRDRKSEAKRRLLEQLPLAGTNDIEL